MFVKLLKANSSGIRYTIFHNMHIISSGWTHKHVLSTGKFIRLLHIIDEIKLARSFNFTSRYIDDVLSLTIKHVRIKYLLDTDFSLVHTYYIHVV
jgi:hypothetical protein